MKSAEKYSCDGEEGELPHTPEKSLDTATIAPLSGITPIAGLSPVSISKDTNGSDVANINEDSIESLNHHVEDISNAKSRSAPAEAAPHPNGTSQEAWTSTSSTNLLPPPATSTGRPSKGGKWGDDGTVTGRKTSKLVLNPSSPFFRRWDALTACLLLYTAIVTPFEVGFLKSRFNALFLFNQFVNLCFFIDVWFNFFMPFELRGIMVMDLGAIQRRYLSFWFWIDIVSIAPFDIWGVATKSQTTSNLKVVRIVRLLRLAKLARILRAGRMFQRFETAYAINYSQLSLVKFTIVIIFLAHWMACFWALVEDIQGTIIMEGEIINWINNYSYISGDSEAVSQYLAALYWAVATLSTLGYGDVVPTTDWERLYVILCTILGASVYAYTVGAVCSIFASMDRRRNEFYSVMDKLNTFIDEQNIAPPLAAKLRGFFRYTYSQLGGASDADAKELLDMMSPSLRQDVAVGVHSHWIRHVSFFKGVGEDFIMLVASKLRGRHYPVQENIITAGELANTMYIVQKGVVACKGVILTKGKAFGTDMVYKSFKRTYAAVTFTNVTVLVLGRADIFDFIHDYPDTAKKLRLAATKIVFRDTIMAYAEAVKETIREANGEKPSGTIDKMFSSDMLPVVFQHRLRVMFTDHPEEYERLELATLKIQRATHKYRVDKRKNAIQHYLKDMPPNYIDGAKIAIRLGLQEHLKTMKDQQILDIEVLAALSPEAVYACTGMPMGNCFRLVQTANQHLLSGAGVFNSSTQSNKANANATNMSSDLPLVTSLLSTPAKRTSKVANYD
eukprot:CAMPEP_0197845274 /NCGR_PEP_ID=MMETSP1438-20131217/2229_1 /TAXON_ID=1461541 /ORGANISM="Pterosperma sp., Strain CCMP1384" /LENGTH=787 /DNA_ID=CAMNT_0043456501 /DNA_START=335 /DNA_END=2698 /DNA_ORIENTATION=+